MNHLDPVDAALAAVVDGTPAGSDDGGVQLLDIDELAAASDMPVAVLEAIHREGLLIARSTDPLRFTAGDADTVRAAMAMLATGLPLAEFLDLARSADRALRDLAAQAVEAFLLYVRDPARGAAEDPDRTGDALVDAFQQMLPAVRGLVAAHFEALVLAEARARLDEAATDVGDHHGQP